MQTGNEATNLVWEWQGMHAANRVGEVRNIIRGATRKSCQEPSMEGEKCKIRRLTRKTTCEYCMQVVGKKCHKHRSGGKKLKSSERQENPASNLVWR